MKKLFVFVIIVAGIEALAGQSGNGGNVCAAQFTRFGNIIHQTIKDNSFFKSKINMNLLLEKIQTAKVTVVTGDLIENGGIADAKNYPLSNTIEVHQRWCEYSFKQKHVLVLHEYLGLVDPNLDSSYQLSAALYRETGVSESRFDSIFSETKDMSFSFECFTGYESKKIVLDQECARNYEAHVYVLDRDKSRVKIDCDKGGTGALEYFATYLYYGKNSHYDETYRTDFLFASKKVCEQAYNAAKVVGGTKKAEVIFNLDTSQVELFRVN